MTQEILSPLEHELLKLLSNGPHTRSELVQLTETPRTTVYDNLQRLIELGVVNKRQRRRNTRGRPKVEFFLDEMEED